MASAWIVKVAQDNSEAPVLLHITQEGEKDLHLDVVGTEGEAVYHGKGRNILLGASDASVLSILQFEGKRLPRSNQTMRISQQTSLSLLFAMV